MMLSIRNKQVQPKANIAKQPALSRVVRTETQSCQKKKKQKPKEFQSAKLSSQMHQKRIFKFIVVSNHNNTAVEIFSASV
jgi:hypothetical protein